MLCAAYHTGDVMERLVGEAAGTAVSEVPAVAISGGRAALRGGGGTGEGEVRVPWGSGSPCTTFWVNVRIKSAGR